MKNLLILILQVIFFFFFLIFGMYGLMCTCQEDYNNNSDDNSLIAGPMEDKEKEALYSTIQGFVGEWWNGSDLYPDPCGWTPIQGVSCDLYNGLWYVTSLNIGSVHDNSLNCSPNATFTHHLFELKYLNTISFYNCFTSPQQTPTKVPTSNNWEKLSNNLESLEFRSNPGLVGEISDLGALTNLRSLVLQENGLMGELPTTMGNLVNLQTFVCSKNHFEGQIPASLGGLTKLLIVDLSRNSLSGQLPSTLGGLTSLLKLDLSLNFLEGNIPVEIGNLRSLILLDLSNNCFTGGLIQSFQEMVALEDMVLRNNPMDGNLDGIEWEKLEKLQFLDLSNMGLIGNIPNSLAKVKKLRYLGLKNNSLTGDVSAEFETIPSLGAFYLQGNNFSGPLEFSEAFYRKLGNRFRASDNQNLCYSTKLKRSRHVPSGVKPCQDQENNGVGINLKMSEGDDLRKSTELIASSGSSSKYGHGLLWNFTAKRVIVFVLWIMLF